MAFCWRADDGPIIVLFGSFSPLINLTPPPPKKKKKKKKQQQQKRQRTNTLIIGLVASIKEAGSNLKRYDFVFFSAKKICMP